MLSKHGIKKHSMFEAATTERMTKCFCKCSFYLWLGMQVIKNIYYLGFSKPTIDEINKNVLTNPNT
jgi:hypothetical protein